MGARPGDDAMPKINPFLWFDKEAEEAANFYVSVFPNSKLGRVMRNPDGGDKVLTVDFELDGEAFTALNGGPHFKISEAVSFMIHCKDQAEVDRYWDALIADGGQPSQCGWLKDKYGVSWQVTPDRLLELNTDPDRDKAARVFAAMLKMGKIDIARLEEAAKG
jgi:predicted 3-demethylubiquinone-9 3-methyltransferase (glyoxalase superfamily)